MKNDKQLVVAFTRGVLTPIRKASGIGPFFVAKWVETGPRTKELDLGFLSYLIKTNIHGYFEVYLKEGKSVSYVITETTERAARSRVKVLATAQGLTRGS